MWRRWYANNPENLLRAAGQEEEHIHLAKKCTWGSRVIDLPSSKWETFINDRTNRNNLQTFRFESIILPPSPFLNEKLLPMLTNNAKLYSLELPYCDLGSDGIAHICSFLETNTSLCIIDLSSIKIESIEDANRLSMAIKNHKELSLVNLSGCYVGKGDEGGPDSTVLERILDGCKTMKSLIIDKNQISKGRDFDAVKSFLADNTTITVLSLEDVGFETAHVKKLCQALKKNTSLRHLSLGSNTLSVPSFLPSRGFNDNLIHLDLSANGIRAQGASVVAEFLSKNHALMELSLACNKIPSAAAVVLGKALQRNSTLEHLDLTFNIFSNKCVPAFADALKHNKTLLSLHLGGNNIKMAGRVELVKRAICDTTSLESIADSNHTCQLFLSSGKTLSQNSLTKEDEMKKINALNSEGQKIRYKVVLALFAINTDLFKPRDFERVPLELMHHLLDMVQHEVGYKGYGKEILKGTSRKVRKNGFNPTLDRLYAVVMGWNTPLLFAVRICNTLCHYTSCCCYTHSYHLTLI